MKMKVSGELREQKNVRKAHRKYSIRGFERNLPSAVDVADAAVVFFVLFLCWLFENKRQTTIKPEVGGKWTEKKNGGKFHS